MDKIKSWFSGGDSSAETTSASAEPTTPTAPTPPADPTGMPMGGEPASPPPAEQEEDRPY
jgi:hypothetical protein